MPVPEHLRTRQQAEVTLKSGLKVGVELPNARDLIFAGDIAWTVLERVAQIESKAVASNGAKSELTDEERREYQAFERLCVARMIYALPDESGELQPATVTEDELGFLTDTEFRELASYAMRVKALPKARTPKATKAA